MEQNVYIPGDLVMTNGVPLGTKEGVVYRITACDPSKTLKLNDGTVLKGTVCLENIEGASIGDKGFLMGDCCAWVKDIVLIPLTPEILEKNGWTIRTKTTFNGEHLEDYSKPDFRLGHFSIAFTKEGIKVTYDCLPIRDLKYISDLQHLLFGLGLDSRFLPLA